MQELARKKNYFYDMDYNFYHKSGKKEFGIERITRAEYKRQTGESDYIIEKLRNSLFPQQFTDYYFHRIINKSGREKYIPIDWKLINLIKYFDKTKYEPINSDQGDFYSYGNIYFNYSEDTLNFLKDNFGSDAVITEHNHDYSNGQLKFDKKEIELLSQYKILIRVINFTRDGNYVAKNIAINFKKEIIPWIHRIFGVKMPNREGAHTGGRIVRSPKTLEFLKKIV